MWNRLSVPKHRFISWLIMLERLRTADRLVSIGIRNDDSCVLCPGKESHKHLFFECEYSLKRLRMLQNWMGICQSQKWFNKLVHFLSKSKRSQFQRRVIAAAYCALAYYIWWARNEVVWNLTGWRPEAVMKKLQSIVMLRVGRVLPKKMSVKDNIWFGKLEDENV